ncbi:hypothetical protein NHP21011_13310 [Helicobacter heilmannii]|nr:hypothetical protein NHP21011_13310 [Helicobacter heilmannii]
MRLILGLWGAMSGFCKIVGLNTPKTIKKGNTWHTPLSKSKGKRVSLRVKSASGAIKGYSPLCKAI